MVILLFDQFVFWITFVYSESALQGLLSWNSHVPRIIIIYFFYYYLFKQKPVPCQAFTSKLPKMGQPDLDFTAPEIQINSKCSPLSDMFSLGLVICAVYNGGHSIIESNLSCATYQKQLEMVSFFVHAFFFNFCLDLFILLIGFLWKDAAETRIKKYVYNKVENRVNEIFLTFVFKKLHRFNFYTTSLDGMGCL